MSVDITNETGWEVQPMVFSDLAMWTMDQMRVSPQSDLSIAFIDPQPMAELHVRWMGLEGPTDVMSFPMDQLRPGDEDNRPEGLLGDIILCPQVASMQAAAAGHSTIEEMMLLTIHGVLHLLGYDHKKPDEEKRMFALQRQLLLTFLSQRPGALVDVLPPGQEPDTDVEGLINHD
ncbi:putative metalloprotease [Scardovia inopinata]|uniref:Endoribonuclease YbeY n=1 Tax=Scardovia inopinata F0304 TaxID=641146 RepID=W5IJA2_SCAIO|nr:rRNA maturation RNase YbeY [Scardovia inopinata]EFG27080.1 metalloprotein, YbeY/UPF0054family [Scardovia inopinata F0304]BAR06692.1 conserved hypothetical protein [Scardovia inopinata JCM 12537]SUV52289.1 putative metalloprotease [Scardovia inopinata]